MIPLVYESHWLTNLAYSGQDDESIRHRRLAVALRPGDSNALYNAATNVIAAASKETSISLGA
jgi:hypothetical protein